MAEKYSDCIINKAEYNAWAKKERTMEYSNDIDKMQLQLMFDKDMPKNERAEIEKQIEDKKIEIKEKYKYV